MKNELHGELIAILNKANRAYFFGVFMSKKDKLHVAAFRHIKNRKNEGKAFEWKVYDPYFNDPISLIEKPKKF